MPCWWAGWWLWRAGCISHDTYLLYDMNWFHYKSRQRRGICIAFGLAMLLHKLCCCCSLSSTCVMYEVLCFVLWYAQTRSVGGERSVKSCWMTLPFLHWLGWLMRSKQPRNILHLILHSRSLAIKRTEPSAITFRCNTNLRSNMCPQISEFLTNAIE